MKHELLPLDPATFRRHPLHDESRAWGETNCYVDLWIEVMHAHGFDPTAALAFTLSVDFEGDQWLFFKQPTFDMYELYGIDVQELNIFRPVLEHIAEQLERGRLVVMELDSHFLPDTAGATYRRTHGKTTVGIQSLDLDERRLGYFHNAGYHTLEGPDFVGLFGLDGPKTAAELPPYTEFAKLDPRVRPSKHELLEISLGQLRRHLKKRPSVNPIAGLRQRFPQDILRLQELPREAFHLYSFAALRQCGASFELAASYMEWLMARGDVSLAPARDAFDTLSKQAKALQFKAASTVMLKRKADFSPFFDAMESAYAGAFHALEHTF